MASNAFAFYRGSACLFYADVSRQDDPFAKGPAGRVWIQGDLHAENFGTYMNSEGRLVFDVNDFDEAYVGPFTWDLQRLAASLALLGYQKAMSDDQITQMISTTVNSYLAQVKKFAPRSTPGRSPSPWPTRTASCWRSWSRRACTRGSRSSTRTRSSRTTTASSASAPTCPRSNRMCERRSRPRSTSTSRRSRPRSSRAD